MTNVGIVRLSLDQLRQLLRLPESTAIVGVKMCSGRHNTVDLTVTDPRLLPVEDGSPVRQYALIEVPPEQPRETTTDLRI